MKPDAEPLIKNQWIIIIAIKGKKANIFFLLAKDPLGHFNYFGKQKKSV